MTYNRLDFETRKKLLKGPFGKELLKTIMNSTAVLAWADLYEDDLTTNHGSMFFVDTGKVILAITARHVYDKYAESIAQNPRISCQINDLPFAPHARLIGFGTDIDLATFWLTRAELKQLQRITVPWPPLIPKVGQDVLFAGMPGAAKTRVAPRQVACGVYARLATVDSVNDRDISLVKPPNELLLDIMEKGLPPPAYKMGGMSGGPVAIVLDTGIVSWAVSGVICECHETYEIVKAVRADMIDQDGNVVEADFTSGSPRGGR